MNLTAATTILGLTNLDWLAYEVTVGSGATSLLPPQLVVQQWASIAAGAAVVTFTAGTGSAGDTKWLRPGMMITIAGITGVPQLNQKYTVITVTPASGTFTAKPQNRLTHTVTIAGGVEGSITCNIVSLHAQKAYIAVPAAGATVTIAPTAAALTYSYGWRKDIAASGERELFAPAGAKFDMADWYGKTASTQAVQILVI